MIKNVKTTPEIIAQNLKIEEMKKSQIQNKAYWKMKGYDNIQKQMVSKISASLRRNLDNYPLGPGLSKQQRIEIMNKVSKSLDVLKQKSISNYKTFFRFENHTSKKEEELGDLMVKIEDKFLKEC